MNFELPADFIEDMEKILGPETAAFLDTYQVPSLHALRFRNETYEAELTKCPDLLPLEEKVEWAPYAYYYEDATKPGSGPLHEMGAFYIQEPSAMGPAALLAPKEGERVLDLCAAPGGKTTELSSIMKDRGLLVANEIHPARAKILASNVERMGIRNALVLNMESGALAAQLPLFFHRILVDAPCSGEGMFRKNPEAIGEWSRENVKICVERQQEILDNAYCMLVPGGSLCYSTCTFAKEENEDTVEAFLVKHGDMKLIRQERFWPHKQKGEGHFMALLQKEGTPDLTPYPGKTATSLTKKEYETLMEFLNGVLTAETVEGLGGESLKKEGIFDLGNQKYLLPKQCPSLRGLKILRPGLHLGEMKKDRFEPSHALALALTEAMVQNSYEMTREETDAFLRGEGIYLNADSKTKNGWCLMTYLHFPVGWSKVSGGQAKNHYPKGLRKH